MLRRLRQIYTDSSTTERIIYIAMLTSLVVWVLGYVLQATGLDLRPSANYLGAYPGGYLWARQPWGTLTYMWVHSDLAHLVLNMLLLYAVGRIYERRYGGECLVVLFVLGGVAGALCYSLGYQLLGAIGVHLGARVLLGCSAGVYALAFALAFVEPQRRVHLLFVGSVRLSWLVVGLFVLDLILKAGNVGGQLAHLGGALLGLGWAWYMRERHTDLTEPIRRYMSRWVSERVTLDTKTRAKRHTSPPADQAQIDDILDKIRRSGYPSLSADERRRLFEASEHLPDRRDTTD